MFSAYFGSAGIGLLFFYVVSFTFDVLSGPFISFWLYVATIHNSDWQVACSFAYIHIHSHARAHIHRWKSLLHTHMSARACTHTCTHAHTPPHTPNTKLDKDCQMIQTDLYPRYVCPS